MYAIAHKIGKMVGRRVVILLCLAALGSWMFAIPVTSAEAQKGEAAITCTNPYSGVTWQITIDYDRSTVDGNSARISDSEISWRDRADGGNYTLDRKSGNLTVIAASSTGGFFLHDRCKLEN